MNNDENKRLVTEWRLENLNNVLSLLNENKMKARRELAKEIEDATNRENVNSELGKFLRSKNPIPIGHNWASDIEEGIELLAKKDEMNGISRITPHCRKQCFLDTPPDTDACAYVLAEVRVGCWRTVCEELQKNYEIKEMALVFGDSMFNCFIKVEAAMSQLNSLIINKIVSNINIQKTHTLHVTPYSQFQLQQPQRRANFSALMSDETTSESFSYFDPNKFDKTRIRKLFFNQWVRNVRNAKRVCDGVLKIKQTDQLQNLPMMIAEDAEQRILAVVNWEIANNHVENERNFRYLEAQKKRISLDRGFEVKRVFYINDVSEFEKDQSLAIRIGHELNAGVTLRYLCKWPNLRKYDVPRDFGIADSFASWYVLNERNDENLRMVEFQYNHDGNIEFDETKDDFDRLWDDSKSIPLELQEHCKNAFKESGRP